MKPKIKNVKIIHDGSDYCDFSIIHSLSHEIMKIPIKILGFNIDYGFTTKKKYIAKSSDLKVFLQPIIEKNNIINEFLANILPIEVINIILKYLWNHYIDIMTKIHFCHNI